MTTIFNKELSGRKVSLKAKNPEGDRFQEYGTIHFEAGNGTTFNTVTFSWDKSDGSFHISSTLNAFGPSNASCFIICGIALAGPILDCYNNNPGNWGDFVKCLEAQKHSLSVSTASCLTGCLQF